jgi:hypothetical protein
MGRIGEPKSVIVYRPQRMVLDGAVWAMGGSTNGVASESVSTKDTLVLE